jgi:thiol-disulfide isomerase/thioredoxin
MIIMRKLKAMHVVYADWCPHCVPTTVEPVKKKAEQIGARCILYNIDHPEASEKADELVRKYGDWSEDYLIPQVFLEYEDGEVKHVFTGYSEDIELTRSCLHHLLESHLLN